MRGKEPTIQRCHQLDFHEMVAWKGLGIRRPLLRKRRARKKWLKKLSDNRYAAKSAAFGFRYGGHFGPVCGNRDGDSFFVPKEWDYADLETRMFLPFLVRDERHDSLGPRLIECLKRREHTGCHVIHQAGEFASLQSIERDALQCLKFQGPSILTISETAADGVNTSQGEDAGKLHALVPGYGVPSTEDYGYGWADDAGPFPPEQVRLFSSSLLSKWGFGDGDMLDWLGYDFGVERVHDVLFALVRDKMLPLLDQKVELERIGTSHNPCRAAKVNGEDVTQYWYSDAPDGLITPDCVTLTGQEVLDFAMEFHSKGRKL